MCYGKEFETACFVWLRALRTAKYAKAFDEKRHQKSCKWFVVRKCIAFFA